MKDTLYVLETVRNTFIVFEQVGEKELKAFEIEEYYLAEMFDSEEEVATFEELLNTGKTSNPHIRPDWRVTIDSALLPVRKRTLLLELLPS